MRISFSFLFALLSLCFLLPSACADATPNTDTPTTEAIDKNYEEAMDWLIKQSNEYSGVLNPRQTWILSYDGYLVKEEYFWDGEPTLTAEFDIRNISKAKVEERFTNSIALYPKDGKSEHFKVIRTEEGEREEVESEYFNWMVFPEMKKETLERMNTVLELLLEK